MCGWLTSQDGDHLPPTADLNFKIFCWQHLQIAPLTLTRFQCVQKKKGRCSGEHSLLRLFSHCDWFTIYYGEQNAWQRDGISLTCRLRAHPSPLVHYLPAFHSFFVPVLLDINQHFYMIDRLFVWFSLSLPPRLLSYFQSRHFALRQLFRRLQGQAAPPVGGYISPPGNEWWALECNRNLTWRPFFPLRSSSRLLQNFGFGTSDLSETFGNTPDESRELLVNYPQGVYRVAVTWKSRSLCNLYISSSLMTNLFSLHKTSRLHCPDWD